MLVSDGFNILGDIVDQLVAELPPGQYVEVTRASQQLQMLLNPTLGSMTPDDATLLGLLQPGAAAPHTILD
jgi:hypothetical protein